MSEPDLFEPIMQAISSPHDPWLTAADFASYVAAQQRVAKAYRDVDGWVRMSILNSASSGRFSTDRTIAEYNDEIWRLPAIPAYPVKLPE
jgi:glycogen phosphorylase